MKLIIAGSRTINLQPGQVEMFLSLMKLDRPIEVVSGGAAGIDTAAQDYAKDNRLIFALFEPDWERYGKSAGPIRNVAMAAYGDALLLIWDGKSRGSASMKKAMNALRKPIYEVIVQTPQS